MTSEFETSDELDLPRLDIFLRSEGIQVDGPLTGRLLSGGKSNLTFAVTDGSRRWVLRRPPVGDILPGAHSMVREYRVMEALMRSAVPVPSVVALCRDHAVIGTEFYLMEELDARVIRTQQDALQLTVEQRGRLGNELVDVLGAMHDLDYRAVGLADFGRPDGYLERQLARWARQLLKVQTQEFPQVARITAVLGSRIPQRPGSSLVHGDYRLDNVMVSTAAGVEIEAVLDWEMATLGDPLADLGTLLMFWDEPGEMPNPITNGLMGVEGFPRRSDVIERYVSARGIKVDDLDWYLVFSEFKLAVILEQIRARHERGETVGDGFEGLDQMVSDLLDSAHARIENATGLRRLA